MKTKLLFFVLTLFIGALQMHSQITLSHHVDPVTVDTSGLFCGSSGGGSFDNHFARVYNLNTFGIAGDFLISAVEVGIGADGSSVGKMVTVNVYTSDNQNLSTAVLTLISTSDLTLQTTGLSLISVPIEANIPAGSIVVVETFSPENPTLHNHPGFNLSGHSGTAWVKVPVCGQPNWIDANNSGVGDQQHILINIVGLDSLGINDEFFENAMIYPNPTVRDFTIDLAVIYGVVNVTITNILGQRIATSKFNNTNKLELSIDGKPGIYFATIHTSEGKRETLKIIKN